MSTQTEIQRLQTARNDIRDKLVELGLAEETAKLDVLATAVKGIAKRGAVKKTLSTTETSFDIEAGYHGAGTVSITLDKDWNVIPTKSEQIITPSSGTVLNKVTVAPIPDAYHDVSDVETPAEAVLSGYVIVNKAGETVTGTMPDNGTINRTLGVGTDNQSYTIPAGYHSGLGKVDIIVGTKNVTPDGNGFSVKPDEGEVLGEVFVGAIPPNYVITTDANAKPEDILFGKTAYVAGTKLVGDMPNNGTIAKSMNGLAVTKVTIPAGYTNGGQVILTNEIEMALAAI